MTDKEFDMFLFGLVTGCGIFVFGALAGML